MSKSNNKKRNSQTEYQAYLKNKLEFLFFCTALFGPLILFIGLCMINLLIDLSIIDWFYSFLSSF